VKRAIKSADAVRSSGDPLWYKHAILYFHDSNADGIGDFKGLAEKLDYLQDLSRLRFFTSKRGRSGA